MQHCNMKGKNDVGLGYASHRAKGHKGTTKRVTANILFPLKTLIIKQELRFGKGQSADKITFQSPAIH